MKLMRVELPFVGRVGVQSIAGWGRMHEILSLVNIAASSAAA
jgi:hypothetical protein